MPPSAHHHTNCNYVLLLDDAVGINMLTSSVLSASSLHSAQEICSCDFSFCNRFNELDCWPQSRERFLFFLCDSEPLSHATLPARTSMYPSWGLPWIGQGVLHWFFFTWEVCSDRGSGEKQPPSCAAILPSDDLHFLSLLKASQINLAVVCLREHLTLTLCSAVACLICIRSPLLLSKGSPHRLSHPSLFTLNLRRR